ncbi:MAG: sulfate reduction electron transfer complex DsrMKJOP subunit DsrO, partial [Mycobacterium leprae]
PRGVGVPRRQRGGIGGAGGVGAAPASLLPKVELVNKAIGAEAAPKAAGNLAEEGFALVTDAANLGKLIKIGPQGVAEAANAPGAPLDSNNRRGAPYSVPPTHQWVMVVDLEKCDGCRQCTAACDKMHDVPAGQEWVKVYTMRDNQDSDPYFIPRFCNHCDNPPCVKVCPVGATFKREDGIVLIDQDRCVGCRFCIAACPYSARSFNWTEPQQTAAQKAQPYDIEMNTPHRKGVVDKCLFCPELLEKGKLPACATSCEMGAIYFGDRNEDAVTNGRGDTLKLSDVKAHGATRLLEELGTEPRVYYLPPRNRKYPGPASK